jgi:hypothetical protein
MGSMFGFSIGLRQLVSKLVKTHHADNITEMHSFLMIDMCVSMHGSHQQE